MAPKKSRTSLELAFGQVVRAERQRAGLSQEALGYRADLHRTYLSMLERGERCPSLETIAKLAKALDTRASELVAAWERRFGSQ